MNLIPPTLYIVRGLPGSGKSTLAVELIANGTATAHYEADMYFMYPDGEYVFDPSRIKRAHEWCLLSTLESLQEGEDVIVSNTFTTLKEIRPYFDMARDVGADVEIITCTGEYGSVHGVPEATLEKMKRRFVTDEEINKEFELNA